MTDRSWEWWILRSWIWKIDPEILISSRGGRRFYLLSDRRRALISRGSCTLVYISHDYLSWIYDRSMSEGFIWKIPCIWYFYADFDSSICKCMSQSQRGSSYRSDASICQLWMIFAYLLDDFCWYPSEYITLHGI